MNSKGAHAASRRGDRRAVLRGDEHPVPQAADAGAENLPLTSAGDVYDDDEDSIFDAVATPVFEELSREFDEFAKQLVALLNELHNPAPTPASRQ